MKRSSVAAFGIAILGAGLLAGDPGVRAGVIDDDLAVVRRAVAQAAPATPTPQAAQEEKPPVPSGARPQWLRVRVTEPGGKRVRMNLPLALVRALGDWPIDYGCPRNGERRRCTLRIGDVLNALDAGQSLVEVDDDYGTKVRIWVE